MAALKLVLAFGVVVLMVACSASGATSAHPGPPALSWSQAEQLMMRADDLRRQALESPGGASLDEVFSGFALRKLESQSQSLGARGIRDEERSSSRELVFWDPYAE